MSIKVDIKNLSVISREKIHKELEIKIEQKFGGAQPRYIYPYEIDGDDIKLPFSYAANLMKIKRPQRSNYIGNSVKFCGTLRPEQKVVFKDALKRLSSTGCVMISAYPGFGKTCLATLLASSTGFLGLVIVNKIVLMKQWEESIAKFCPSAKILKITPKICKDIKVGKITDNYDFYIINAQNVEKVGKTFFSNIGTVIVDEAHMIMAETLSKSLQYVYPRYLIGLTATPYRPDGLNSLLDIYFGKYKIIRTLHKEHIAYKVTTGFKPIIEYSKNGRVNWGVILDSQANDTERNELIVKIVCHFSTRNFLILVKRVSQGEYLEKRLLEMKQDVTSLLGDNQIFDTESRILIGTNSKIGVGFDHSKLDALLLAADVEEYFIQYLGRVFRTEEVKPIVFDLVDNYSILNKHWMTRRKVYQDHGGIVKNFDIKDIIQ